MPGLGEGQGRVLATGVEALGSAPCIHGRELGFKQWLWAMLPVRVHICP